MSRRGDIYRVPENVMSEFHQPGDRFVVIISPNALNDVSQTPVVVPISNKQKIGRLTGFAVSLQDAGTKTTGHIRCDLPRAMDLRSRNARYVESLPKEILEEVLARVITIFE